MIEMLSRDHETDTNSFLFIYSMEGGELFSRIQEKQNFNEQGELSK